MRFLPSSAFLLDDVRCAWLIICQQVFCRCIVLIFIYLYEFRYIYSLYNVIMTIFDYHIHKNFVYYIQAIGI